MDSLHSMQCASFRKVSDVFESLYLSPMCSDKLTEALLQQRRARKGFWVCVCHKSI